MVAWLLQNWPLVLTGISLVTSAGLLWFNAKLSKTAAAQADMAKRALLLQHRPRIVVDWELIPSRAYEDDDDVFIVGRMREVDNRPVTIHFAEYSHSGREHPHTESVAPNDVTLDEGVDAAMVVTEPVQPPYDGVFNIHTAFSHVGLPEGRQAWMLGYIVVVSDQETIVVTHTGRTQAPDKQQEKRRCEVANTLRNLLREAASGQIL